MKHPAIACRPTDTLNRAAELMWKNDIGAVLVTGDDEEVVGIVTDRDISMAAYTQGLALSQLSVEDAMAKEVFSCGPSETMEAIEKCMQKRQVRRMPVVDESNRPLGMVSMNDVARYVDSHPKNGVSRELVRTLAAVSTPRPTAPTNGSSSV